MESNAHSIPPLLTPSDLECMFVQFTDHHAICLQSHEGFHPPLPKGCVFSPTRNASVLAALATLGTSRSLNLLGQIPSTNDAWHGKIWPTTPVQIGTFHGNIRHVQCQLRILFAPFQQAVVFVHVLSVYIRVLYPHYIRM